MSAEPAEPRTCDYCQSPLSSSRWTASAVTTDVDGGLACGHEPDYCCLGCRMAAAIVQEGGESGAARGLLTRLGLSIFFTMILMAFTMALWTTDVYEAADPSNRLLSSMHGLFRHVVLLSSLPVLWLLGLPLFLGTWESLRRGIVSTDALLSLGVAAAFAASFVSVFRGDGPVYFEVACVILVMTTLGRWLEATGRLKATSALDALARLLPATVRRIVSDEGTEREEAVALSAIVPGDFLRVLPGERFPADARVSRHAALVDEQVLTGESRAVLKEPGAKIWGGTLNLDGDLIIEITATGQESALARLVELVKQARMSKGRYQRLVDRCSTLFFPIVAMIAVLAFLAHWATGSLEQALMASLAVSLIACPCALGLATPLAVWSALGQAAGHQVLFRGGESLERLADVKAIRFDKTGTLTTGTAAVRSCQAEHSEDLDDVLARSAALAASTSHALSTAIVAYGSGERSAAGIQMDEVRVVPGRGVVGRFRPLDISVSLGSPQLMEERGLHLGPRLDREIRQAHDRGLSLAMIGWNGEARGLFTFDEQRRPSYDRVIEWLKAHGLDVGVLTGDHSARARAVSKELGVNVEAELLPEQKVSAIGHARDQHGPVAMVGDGVNDAPALAASDVGVALGCGTDVSRDSAAICLLGNDLSRIPWAIELARRTVRTIRWNLAWAFGYNILGVLAAAMGWLNPAIAALLMVASSAMVIANSLRLRSEFPFELTETKGTAAVDSPESPAPSSPRQLEATLR